eukprot:g67.t1
MGVDEMDNQLLQTPATGRTATRTLEMSQRVFRCFSAKTLARMGNIVKSLWFQGFILSLILLDLFLFFVELSVDPGSPANRTIYSLTVLICTILVLEVLLRLVWMDPKPFFSDPWCCFDFAVSVGSLALLYGVKYAGGALIVLRLARFPILRYLRCVRFVGMGLRRGKVMPRALQAKIAHNRRQLEEDGWDIDVTYITDRVLAMSAPTADSETQLARFFNERHVDAYLILNTAPASAYDYRKFNNSVREYFMERASPAPLATLLAAVKEMKGFLDLDVAAVVCVTCS